MSKKNTVCIPWSQKDSELVRVMYATTATTEEIGRLVGRTPASVRMRARTLGLSKLPRVPVNGKSKAKPKPPRLAMQVVDPIVRARQFDARMRAMAFAGDIPVRNSTMRGDPYTCPELRTNPHRAG